MAGHCVGLGDVLGAPVSAVFVLLGAEDNFILFRMRKSMLPSVWDPILRLSSTDTKTGTTIGYGSILLYDQYSLAAVQARGIYPAGFCVSAVYSLSTMIYNSVPLLLDGYEQGFQTACSYTYLRCCFTAHGFGFVRNAKQGMWG